MTSIHRLSNGITLVMEEMPYLKSAAFGVWVRVGSANEDETNNGIAHMIEHMMFKGTKNRTGKQIADEMARIGGNINAFTSKECTSYYATTLSQHLPIAIRIIGDMLNNSLFDEKALRKEKSVIIEEIDMYEDSPEDLAHELLQQRIWKGHPLGYMISGKKTIVRKINKDQILDFMDSYYTGENIVISIAGSFNQREILSLVEEEFGKIKAKSTKLIKSPDKPRYHKVVCKRNKDIEQLHINIAFDGISYLSDERFTLSVLNCIFGGSVNSRLFQKIREDEGLTYSIYSYGSSYKDTGLLHIYAAMNPNQKDMVIDMIYNEIYQLKSKGITKDELIMTKEQIKTELILGSEGARNRMNSNGKSMLNRGRIVSINELIDNIEKVSLDDVISFANRYLDLSNSSISLVGNLK
ncbi:M16 family metallopeptidase [Herbinix luporum]|uniref:Putative zinc protease YmxG n=1 Tax=Herbinix luporum TaxID=1679721 RepID=A0A0K8J481_9FIRM|nr:pitrilysin family protein [Herbinix luporum]CUH92471.1 putative zinc protease YmxG [Herbinix luporum]